MENENKFTATGALFTAKSKKTENSPDYSGSMELEMDVVDDLIAQKQEGISQPKINMVELGHKICYRNALEDYPR